LRGPTEAMNLLVEKIHRIGHGYRMVEWPTIWEQGHVYQGTGGVV
jgi:hypothetical protein